MPPEYEYILQKMESYCAYQERCVWDVKNKMSNMKLKEHVADKIIEKLIKNDFINEERYARIFAESKFRLNKWGRSKIVYALQQKNIPDIYIQLGLNSIDDEEYLNTLKMIISKKDSTLRDKDPYKRREKLARYAISKGYSSGIVWKVLNNITE